MNPEVRIETTNHCNAHCTICPRGGLTRPRTIMDNDHFYELVQQARRMGATDISLFGYGEPLLDDNLSFKIRLCKDFNTHITTNGSLLDVNAAFDLLGAGLKHIRFSAHGFGESYEKVHRGLKWGDFLFNIFNFMKINDVHFNHVCMTETSVIPMYGETIEVIKEFWERHVDYLEIWKPHNWVTGKNYRELKQVKKTCGRPFRGPVQIQADGKMIVCCFDTDGRLEVGDTHKNTIEEILRGDRFKAIREAHRAGNLDGLICSECDQLNIEPVSPLLYSSRDKTCQIGKTSSTKFNLEV